MLTHEQSLAVSVLFPSSLLPNVVDLTTKFGDYFICDFVYSSLIQQALNHLINVKGELPAFLIKPVQRVCKYPLLLDVSDSVIRQGTISNLSPKVFDQGVICRRLPALRRTQGGLRSSQTNHRQD